MNKLKSLMINKYFSLVLLSVLAGLAMYFFKANLGVDFANADLYIFKTDNAEISEQTLVEANKLSNLVRIEKVNNTDLYLYFQNQNADSSEAITTFALNHDLKQSGQYQYKFAVEEFYLLANRIATFILISIVAVFFYYAVEMRQLSWYRWQVLYYIFCDILLTVIVTELILGLASAFGQLGLKMENDFVIVMAIIFGITSIYRMYEMEILKRLNKISENGVIGQEIIKLFKTRKPEIIMLSSVLVLIGFMPFVVIGMRFTVLSILLISSISFNHLAALYYKPEMLAFLMRIGAETKILKKTFLHKKW